MIIDARSYGAVFNGSGDQSTAMQAALDAAVGGNSYERDLLLLPSGTVQFNTGLIIPPSVELVGAGQTSVLAYTGAGVGLLWSNAQFKSLRNFYMKTYGAGATAIEAGTLHRNCRLENVGIESNSGIGLHLNAVSGFCGGLSIDTMYMVGVKWGVKFVGSGGDNWTSVLGKNINLVGNGVGIVSGSRGVEFGSGTNGIGTYFIGGTIEAFEVGIKHFDGISSMGGTFHMDMEGNTTDWDVGASFAGEIVTPHGHRYVPSSTVAQLPSAADGELGWGGRRRTVTDALSPVFNATVVGGGAVTVSVGARGGAWIVGAN